MLKFSRVAFLLLISSQFAHGTLLLYIDANTGNFEWSDSGVSASNVQITQFELSTFYLSNHSGNNPFPAGATEVTGMADTLMFTVNPTIGPPEEILTPTNPGQVYIDALAGIFSMSLGTFYADMGSPVVTVNAGVSAPGTIFSAFTAAEKSFLSSLDDTVLNLYQLSGGVVTQLPVQNTDALQLRVVPIPEPSTLALLFSAAAMFFRRSR